MRNDRQRLNDLLEAIERIERHAIAGREAFDREEMLQVWIVHHLQIIGEAVRGLSEPCRHRSPQIPWKEIIGMRHILVHHYFGIDREAVWRVVEDDLTPLKDAVLLLLEELDEEE